MKILGFLYREPLLHFLAIALLLFAVDARLNGDGRELIRVEPETLDFLVRQRSELLMRELTEAERASLLENHIDEEVLVREAYRRGLDQGGRMRRQLVMRMRSLLADDVPEPTEADLRAFFRANAERYQVPPRVSFRHVFFGPRAVVPEALSAELARLADAPDRGELDPILGRFPQERTERDLSGYLGPRAAAAIFAVRDDRWHGPIRSKRGVHFVRVTERLAARDPDFAALAPYLRPEWQISRQQDAMAAKVASFRARYRVVVPPAAGDPGPAS